MDREKIDFRAVKAAARMRDVLARYGITLRQAGEDSLRGRCPLPTHSSEQSKDSFAVNTSRNIWTCQSGSCVKARDGRRGGNVLDFVAVMDGGSIYDAARKLRDWFGAEVPTPPATTDQPVRDEKKDAPSNAATPAEEGNKPLTFALKGVDPGHAYLAGRGISREVAERFGIGFFSGKGIMSGRVVIPIHNEKGELVAYAGRAIDGTEPRYKLPAGFKKGLVLWNLNRVLAQPATEEPVVLVEGFFDCVSVSEAGYRAVALMGCDLSAAQEELLQAFKRVVVMLDGDEAGRHASQGIASRLMRRHFVRLVDVPEGKQPDGLSAEEIKALFST